MPDTYEISIQGIPYQFDWAGKAPPTVADQNSFAQYVASTPAHQTAAYQAHAPAAPGIDPGVIGQYRQKYFGDAADRNSIPSQTLQKLLLLPPEGRAAAAAASGFSPVGQAALLQEAYQQAPGQYKLPSKVNLARNLGELGITEQQARQQGVSPAVKTNNAKRAALVAQRNSLQTTVAPAGQGFAGPGIDLTGAFGLGDTPAQKHQKLAAIDAQLAALGAPQENPGVVSPQVVSPDIGPLVAPPLADLLGQITSGQAGSEPGTYGQLGNLGFKGKLAQRLLGFAEPMSLATMAAAAPFGAAGLLPFGVQALGGAADEYAKGDPEGAAASLAAFLLPMALHGARGKGITEAEPRVTAPLTEQARVTGGPYPALEAGPPVGGEPAQPGAPFGSPGKNTFQPKIAGGPKVPMLESGPEANTPGGVFDSGPVHPPVEALEKFFGIKGAKQYIDAHYALETASDPKTATKAQLTLEKLHSKLSDAQIGELLSGRPEEVTAPPVTAEETAPREPAPYARTKGGAIPLPGEIAPIPQEPAPQIEAAPKPAEVPKPSQELVPAKPKEQVTGGMKLSVNAANTLGLHIAPGDALGDRLSEANKPVTVTSEEAARLAEIVKRERLDPAPFKTLLGEPKPKPKSVDLVSQVTDPTTLQEQVTATPEEAARIKASVGTERERPNSGLTPTQEQFLANKLKEIAPDLNGKPVTIHIPGDGEYTVSTPQGANQIALNVTGEGVLRDPKTGEAFSFNDQKRTHQSGDGKSAPKIVSAPDVPKKPVPGPKTEGFLGAAVDGEEFAPHQAEAALAAAKAAKSKYSKPKTRVTAKDQAVIDKGAQELNAGVNPFDLMRKAGEKLKGLKKSPGGQKARDIVLGDKPVLTDRSKEALHAVNQAENARTTAKIETDPILPQVLSHLSQDDQARFQTYGVADRALAVRDEVTDKLDHDKLDYHALEVTARKQANAAARAKTRGDAEQYHYWKGLIAETGAKRTALMAEIRAGQKHLDSIAVGRAVDPLRVTLPSGKGIRVTEAGVKAFFARPEIAEAVARHKALIEPLLDRNQAAQGGQVGVSKGKYSGAYFPAEALDENSARKVGDGGARSGGRNAPLAQLATNTAAEAFTGTAHSYAPDYHQVTRNQLERSYSRATERQMHQTLLDEGIAQPVDSPKVRFEDGQRQIEIDGKWVAGKDVTLQRGKRIAGGKIVGAIDPSLETKVTLPVDVYNEIRPLFDQEYQSEADKLITGNVGRFMQAYLMKPADAVQHGAALGSRAAYAKARARKGATADVQAAATSVHSLIDTIRNFNPALFSDAERNEALKFASKTGVLPTDFGNHKGTSILDGILHTGHNILYGDRGILANAVTGVYGEFKKNGALKTPEGRAMLRTALRDAFNTHGATDQAIAGEALRKLGLGTFYKTGVKNRTAAFAAGPRVYAASLVGRVALITAAVTYADKDHRKPWEIPGYKWGDLPVGRDSDGRTIYLNGGLADRTGMYADAWFKSLLTGKNSRYSPMQQGLGSTADLINFAAGPVTSGPLPNVAAGAFGMIPFVHPNDNLSGLELGKSPATKYPYSDPRRALGIAASALPGIGLAYDPFAEASSSEPKAQLPRLINRALPFIGLPPLRSAMPEGAVLQRTQRGQAGERRNAAKAKNL